MLTAPNLVEEHKFRTPLMAAVVRRDLPIFMTLLRRFENQFSIKVSGEVHVRICRVVANSLISLWAWVLHHSLVSSLTWTTQLHFGKYLG